MMGMETNLINRRREEVSQEITRLQKQLAEMEKELVELDTAERVISRLSGAERGTPGAADEHEPETPPVGKPEGIPTMPEMITEALTAAGPGIGVRPKQIRNWIARTYWSGVRGENVSSILWRMWKRGELGKGGGHYRLPLKEETVDASPNKETSTASLFQPDAQGREAGPGGGT